MLSSLWNVALEPVRQREAGAGPAHSLWAVALQILSQEGLAVLSLPCGFLGALSHSHLC